MSIASEITRLQTAKADIKAAIENKGVTVPSAATLDEFSDYIDEISGGGGGGFDWDDFVNGDAPEDVVLTDATFIDDYIFAGTSIKTISSNSVTAIGSTSSNAGRYFVNCKSLTSASFPNVTYLGVYAFDGCTNLESVNFPKLQSIGRGSTDGYIFRNTKVTTLYFPELTTSLGVGTFRSIGTSTRKVTIVLPKLSSTGTDTFRSSYISALDLGPDFKRITNYSLYQGACDTLILRSNTVVTAADVNSIGALSTTSTVYIPKVLYDHLDDGTADDYKSATNWSTIDGYGTITWAAIEGSQYENAYADGTPIPTT